MKGDPPGPHHEQYFVSFERPSDNPHKIFDADDSVLPIQENPILTVNGKAQCVITGRLAAPTYKAFNLRQLTLHLRPAGSLYRFGRPVLIAAKICRPVAAAAIRTGEQIAPPLKKTDKISLLIVAPQKITQGM
jgi:hypothetical protein